MTKNLAFFLVLSLIPTIKCENKLSLKIIKGIGNSYTPVGSTVEETVGANFSLLCDLVSSETDNNDYDFQISWIKQTAQNDVRFWREYDFEDFNSKTSRKFYSVLTQSEMNKAIKRFQPLKIEDNGKYFCISLKYGLHQAVDLIVRDTQTNSYFDDRPMQETIYCSSQMFECTNGVCIISHYTCDGKSDCRDGSDESVETCKGDPCKDKLLCDDGRCIPTSWCCDRDLDPNCTVTHRPKCCQQLSEPYEELEFGPSSVSQAHHRSRYIFISVCVLSILFVVVLLLLVMSRLVLFAKKSNLQVRANNPTGTSDSVAFHSQSGLLRAYNNCDDSSYAYRNNSSRTPRITIFCDLSSDPLLYPADYLNSLRSENDEPPSYVDAVGENLNLSEPPPPYASREVLNSNVRPLDDVNAPQID